MQGGRLLLLPKLSFLETVESSVEVVGNALTADSIDMSFEWDTLPSKTSLSIVVCCAFIMLVCHSMSENTSLAV
jgi:hypothetical protein